MLCIRLACSLASVSLLYLLSPHSYLSAAVLPSPFSSVIAVCKYSSSSFSLVVVAVSGVLVTIDVLCVGVRCLCLFGVVCAREA